jgi:hypothetical protein
MATSMIRQKLGNKIFTCYVPADDENAKALADGVLPGEYQVFKLVGESGSDTVSDGYKKYTVMLKDEESHKSTYLTIVVPKTKNSSDIRNALLGKTFNTVKADKVIVLNEREYTIASSDSGDSGS